MINIPGLVLLLVFYTGIFVLGVIAGRKFDLGDGRKSELALVAGRRLGPIVGIFTMTATLVGGGYLNGTAEYMSQYGLAWTLSPVAIFLGLILGGLFYARRMRQQCYLTMLDPLQEKYGDLATVLIYLASLCGDIFWTASILNALGTSVSVIINLSVTTAIIASSVVATLYTMVGQMVSVAYTDIAELCFIIIGLGVSLPFVLLNENVPRLDETPGYWLGDIDRSLIAVWIDILIAMTFGTIPWQAYFQRVLSVKNARDAQILSIAAAFGGLILAIPPYLIGIVGAGADWTNTSIGVNPIDIDEANLILPHVINEFAPTSVSLLALTAICAAVMSSMDSSILASSSMFTHNIFRNIIYKKSGERLSLWVQRGAILCIAIISTVIALEIKTINGLFVLAADIVFITVLPQLTCAIFLNNVNGYGSITGFFIGVILRLGAGEFYINLKPFIIFPYYDIEYEKQLFPFRTLAFLCSSVTIVIVSKLTNILFLKCIPRKFDILNACGDKNHARYSTKKILESNQL